jgi:hypothetical protein
MQSAVCSFSLPHAHALRIKHIGEIMIGVFLFKSVLLELNLVHFISTKVDSKVKEFRGILAFSIASCLSLGCGQ